MHETIVESVKAFILPKFIKHVILNTMVNIYAKKGIAYIMHTVIFNKMSRLQYNILIGYLNNMTEIRCNNREVTDVYFCRYGNYFYTSRTIITDNYNNTPLDLETTCW